MLEHPTNLVMTVVHNVVGAKTFDILYPLYFNHYTRMTCKKWEAEFDTNENINQFHPNDTWSVHQFFFMITDTKLLK